MNLDYKALNVLDKFVKKVGKSKRAQMLQNFETGMKQEVRKRGDKGEPTDVDYLLKNIRTNTRFLLICRGAGIELNDFEEIAKRCVR